jgi:hypothetical protein
MLQFDGKTPALAQDRGPILCLLEQGPQRFLEEAKTSGLIFYLARIARLCRAVLLEDLPIVIGVQRAFVQETAAKPELHRIGPDRLRSSDYGEPFRTAWAARAQAAGAKSKCKDNRYWSGTCLCIAVTSPTRRLTLFRLKKGRNTAKDPEDRDLSHYLNRTSAIPGARVCHIHEDRMTLCTETIRRYESSSCITGDAAL